jgi:cholest-4-en-3-one 26-monooxygenase
MIMTDPPRQLRMRKLVNQGFSPRRVRRLEAHASELCRRLFDGVVARGECDFVGEIAAELPLQGIAEILGIPEADRREVFTWTNRVLDATLTEQERRAAGAAMYGDAHRLAEERRRRPAADVYSAIVGAELREGRRRGPPPE